MTSTVEEYNPTTMVSTEVEEKSFYWRCLFCFRKKVSITCGLLVYFIMLYKNSWVGSSPRVLFSTVTRSKSFFVLII
jgi:hypothetical protein